MRVRLFAAALSAALAASGASAATLDGRLDAGDLLFVFADSFAAKVGGLLRLGATPSAAGRLVLAWDEDPYLAYRIELTNLGTTPLPVSFVLNTSAVPFSAGSEIRAVIDTLLLDTNGDGTASWTLPGASFGVVESASQMAFLFPPINHTLAAPGSLTSTLGPAPAPPFATWDQLHALGFGNLSAGDTIVIEGFLCATPAGTACPARPLLAPEPAAGALALAGLASLALLGRRRLRQPAIRHGSRPVRRR